MGNPERFSASVAGRHMACPASANLELAIPNWVPPVEDRNADNAANRGTAKHEMLEPLMLLSARDMKHMSDYLAYVAEVRGRRRFNVLVEQEFTATWLQSTPTTKADLVFYTADEVHVLDGKWGKIRVDVHNNEQLLYYAVCAARLAPRAKGVHLHIMQPYAANYDETFVNTNELREFMEAAQEAEAKILAGDITFGPSDHCKFCPANPHGRGAKGSPLCPAMMQMLYPSHIDEDEILGLG